MNAQATLSDSHLRLVVSRIPSDVRKLMIDHSLILAGGFVRSTIAGEKPNDIDLFCAKEVDAPALMRAFSASRQARVHETENAITVVCPPRIPVQLIKRWRYERPEALVADFDFTIAQACVWPERKEESDGVTWRSIIADTYYADLASRSLIYTSPQREEAVGGSIMRVRKFLRSGYQITAPSFSAVLARIFVNIRQSALASGEVGCARVICGLLREVDPLMVVDGLEVIETE